MTQELYSVEQVADRLGLHVRTVRNYVRSGRLKAVRIGKQYRITRDALETLTGKPVETSATGDVRRHRHVEASSIVEIDAVDPDTANRTTNALVAAANTRRGGETRMRVETIYDPVRAHLKIVIIGDLAENAELFRFIGALIGSAS
jgi:excisionase family DNA binding protein